MRPFIPKVVAVGSESLLNRPHITGREEIAMNRARTTPYRGERHRSEKLDQKPSTPQPQKEKPSAEASLFPQQPAQPSPFLHHQSDVPDFQRTEPPEIPGPQGPFPCPVFGRQDVTLPWCMNIA